jgi:hypothetical protein
MHPAVYSSESRLTDTPSDLRSALQREPVNEYSSRPPLCSASCLMPHASRLAHAAREHASRSNRPRMLPRSMLVAAISFRKYWWSRTQCPSTDIWCHLGFLRSAAFRYADWLHRFSWLHRCSMLESGLTAANGTIQRYYPQRYYATNGTITQATRAVLNSQLASCSCCYSSSHQSARFLLLLLLLIAPVSSLPPPAAAHPTI